MLLPIWILHPQCVSAFHVYLLQRSEEFVSYATLRIVTEVISDPGEDQRDNYELDDAAPSPSLASLVILLRVHQGHDLLSIMESGEEEKVPRRGE